MITDAIFARCSTHAPLNAEVGTRIYPVRAPKETTSPYITYREISSGIGGAFDVPVDESRFRFWVHNNSDDVSNNYRECRRIAIILKDTLHNFTGDVTTPSGEVCLIGRYAGQSDTFDLPEEHHGVQIDFFIKHRS